MSHRRRAAFLAPTRALDRRQLFRVAQPIERDPVKLPWALDRPASRSDDWTGLVCGVDRRLAGAGEAAGGTIDEEGGVQQQRHPGLPEERPVVADEPEQDDLFKPVDDDSEIAADKRVMDRISNVSRAYGINEGKGDEKDIIPGF